MMNKILKKINGVLATVSIATMVFSPVAMGKQAQVEAEKLSKAQIEQFIQETGLNKSMTVGEFYKKNKNLFSERVQKMIEPVITQSANDPMPQFEVTENQNSKGEKVATLRITGKNQLTNIQFLGENGKFVKFDNTNLSLDDVADFNTLISRLYYEDASHRKGMGEAPNTTRTLKKQSAVSTTKPTAPVSKYEGLPKITKDMWAKMTPMQRARYMVNMRLLWSGAEAVLDAANNQKTINQKGKKTSALDKWNSFFAMLNGAQAADSTECVVAGYIGKYGTNKAGKTSCLYPSEVNRTTCSNPCNGTIYGFDPNGKQFCVSDAELKTATHFNGACDKKMPLNSVALTPAAGAKNDPSRYAGLADANSAKAKDDPKLVEFTKNYLTSVLNSEDPAMAKAFKEGKIDDAMLDKLGKIQTKFNDMINDARAKCSAAADEKKQFDKQFFGACDQLHARFLSVATYLKKEPGCPGNINSDLKCECPNGMPAVLPGATCAIAPKPPTEVECTPACSADQTCNKTVTPPKCEKTTPPPPPGPGGGDAKCDPACKPGQTCHVPEVDGVKGEPECRGTPSGGGKGDKDSGGGVWGFIKKAAPWVLGAGAIYLIYSKFLKPKKPALNPAADACANGTIPPCGTVCTGVGQVVLASGACGCPACPPGQVQTGISPCACSAGTTTTTLYVCADGVTQVSDLANCPSTSSYTCWDGSTVANPINCPEQTSSTSTTNTNKVETGR